MNYRYVAYTSGGKRLVKGTVSGASEAAATQTLLTRGFRPITIKKEANLPPVEEIFPSLFKVKQKDITMFSRQLATLLDSGITIVPALQLIREEMSNRAFKKIIGELLNDLRSGTPFSEALSKHQEVFGELYCQLVAVGEKTGGGADSLRQAAAYIEKDTATKKKIKKALTYPSVVAAVAVVVMMVLMVFVLPKMTDMLKAMNVPLPITTRLLIGSTGFFAGHFLYIFGGMIVAAVSVVIYVRRPSGRFQLDRILLKVPIVGKANLMAEMARFSRTFVLLLHAGLPLPEILEMAKNTSGNVVVKKALSDVRGGLLQGEGLSEPMSRNKIFPRLLVQMFMVGEESGRLESTLETVAGAYEAEADERISGMVSMIEPAMTIALGIVVGFIALSVITPMYSMTSAFKAG